MYVTQSLAIPINLVVNVQLVENSFKSLFVPPARKPASIARDEHNDLLYSTGPNWNLRGPREKEEAQYAEKVEIRRRNATQVYPL